MKLGGMPILHAGSVKGVVTFCRGFLMVLAGNVSAVAGTRTNGRRGLWIVHKNGVRVADRFVWLPTRVRE